jgi:hypothetical protein
VRRRLLLLLLMGVLGVPAAIAARTGVDEVTLRVEARFDPGTRTRELHIAGRVSNGAAGELVEVQARECGRGRSYRLIGGTRTVSGGSWLLTNERGGVDLFQIPANAYFRARWRGNHSPAVLVRVPVSVWAAWNPRRRLVRVSVSAGGTGYSFRGRSVELQRDLGGGQWLPVRRARLVRARDGLFAAAFAVPTRGLRLRVFAPGATGAPCFSAAASDTWRS